MPGRSLPLHSDFSRWSGVTTAVGRQGRRGHSVTKSTPTQVACPGGTWMPYTYAPEAADSS
jgi:hypothetical protein